MEHDRIVLFDGFCNLCEASVTFIIKRDRLARFRFAPIQSEHGKTLLEKYGIGGIDLKTVVLIKENRLYMKSDAAVEIAKELDGPWKMVYLLKILPGVIRDGIYSYIAENRYRWFGKKETCMIPTQETKTRFLALLNDIEQP